MQQNAGQAQAMPETEAVPAGKRPGARNERLNVRDFVTIAVLTVLCIITLAVFAVRACRAGRSSFYTIAACAATSLLVFQTCLNVFGAVDILPFTGVTLPFVSNGGSSMLSAWGMLAFLKATDTRQNASFAVRLPSRRELRGED